MNHQGKTSIIGTGISGLLAGKILSQAGHSVNILEKSGEIGGRMATRRFKNSFFDHGAQFFTVRDPQFRSWVDHLVEEGVVQEWTRSFSTSGAMPNGDGHPWYKGISGMSAVARNLSQGLNIHLQTRAQSISRNDRVWIVNTEDGREFTGNHLILTAPLPQSLRLLETGNVFLPEREYEELQKIQYLPCIAILVLLNGLNKIPAPGGLKFDSGPIQWLGDNTQKGISPKATAVTIHASADFSRENFDSNPDQLAETLIMSAKPWLGEHIQDWQMHKWRYSQPMQIYPQRFLGIPVLPYLYFAGDAFVAPRVEGAALSGIAVAHHLRNEEQATNMMENMQNFQMIFDRIDLRITRWMARYSLDILRFGLGVIFVWFGALKFFPGLSPAEELVRNTIYFFDSDFFLPILAAWEVLIGIGFLSGFFTNKLMRLTILLLFLQMPGAALPLVLLPEVCWTSFPFGLTLEGQYIIKNLAIIGSALVLGATVRGGRVVSEPINS